MLNYRCRTKIAEEKWSKEAGEHGKNMEETERKKNGRSGDAKTGKGKYKRVTDRHCEM